MTNNQNLNETQFNEGGPKPYHITLEDLMKFEFGERVPQTDTELQTRMKESAAVEKCRFLLDENFAIPTDWYSLENGLSLNKQFLACIHTLYTLVSSANFLKTVQYDFSSSNVNEEGAGFVFEWLNGWMDNRIEREFPFRKTLKVGDRTTNFEAYARSNNKIINTDQHVSEEEMELIMDIFKDRFKS